MDKLLKTIAVLLGLAVLAAIFASPFLMPLSSGQNQNRNQNQNQNKVEIHPSDFR